MSSGEAERKEMKFKVPHVGLGTQEGESDDDERTLSYAEGVRKYLQCCNEERKKP